MKKLLATLLMGAVSAASILGFTACDGLGNNEVPKGKEVTEEEWKSAIEATLNTDNYTATASASENYYNGDIFTTSLEVYVSDEKSYGKGNETTIYTNSTDNETIEKKADFETYMFVEGINLWEANIYSMEYVQGAPEGYEAGTPEWGVYKRVCADENEAKERLKRPFDGIMNFFDVEYVVKEDSEEWQEIGDLYSAFTYTDGKYTATLYVDNSGMGDDMPKAEVKFGIAINDGYIIAFDCIYTYGYGDDSSDETEMSLSVVYKNYGNTKVTAPEGAVAAINKAKTENK